MPKKSKKRRISDVREAELVSLMKEYLATLSDIEEDEPYGTIRELARWELQDFMEWLTEKEEVEL